MLTVELELKRVEGRPDFEREADEVESFWKWFNAGGPRSFFVTSDFDYPTEKFRCALPLPLTLEALPEGFTSVEGVTLVKRRDNLANEPKLYDVAVLRRQQVYHAQVKFYHTMGAEADALRRVVERATSFAGLAIVPVDVGVATSGVSTNA